ncbi:MAG: hypothetical protein EOO38_16360 [Cytophagaceae bacterium]|nr:MAG: hypothetical protein EOO38_16360 [Cytophagaceae bacterium]
MKKNLPVFAVLLLILAINTNSFAQTTLVADQNVRFEESRAKYMQTADSINAWHSTTVQDTYKAIDYLADKAEAREQRRAFRRELRLERARNGYGWYDDYSYGYGYGNGYGNYGYYPNRFNNGYNNRGRNCRTDWRNHRRVQICR